MKRIPFLIATAICALTGCFDVTHYVEVKKDNSVYVDYRLTIMTGNNNNGSDFRKTDSDQLYRSFGLDVQKYKPEVRQIATETETGIEIVCAAPENALVFPAKGAEYTLIPWKDKAGQYVFISRPKNTATDPNMDVEKMANTMFATARYRIVTGGTLAVKKAVIIINDKGTVTRLTPSTYRLGELSFVDMPLSMVMFKESAVIISASDTIDEKEIRAYFEKRNKEREEEAKKEAEKNATPPVDDEEKP